MRRRDILQLGSVAAVGTLLPLSIAATRAIALVHDARYAPARMLAAGSGTTAFALPADPVALWRRDLASAPRIAGLTTYADMLIIADLARAGERRLTMTIAHHLHDTGARHVAHQGPIATRPLAAAGMRWPIALRTLLGGPPGGDAIERDDRRGTLWSWTID